jgi:hypothetical protein
MKKKKEKKPEAKSFSTALKNDLLPTMLQMAVPLYVIQLKDRGGPDKDDMKHAQEWSDKIGERGDILLHGGGKKGECADMFNGLARAVAVLSFCPGGVETFGQHWESKI